MEGPVQVKTSFLNAERLPLVVEPAGAVPSLPAWLAWLRDNRERIDGWLAEHGAILFTGFPVTNKEEFGRALRAIDDRTREYIGGAKVRREIEDDRVIYAPSSVPRYVKNQLHCEVGYQPRLPGKVIFFCQRPSPRGGESLLGDTRRIYQSMPKDLRERFETKGLRFERCLPRSSRWQRRLARYTKMLAVAVNWDVQFGTPDRTEVERQCRETGHEFRWTESDDLLISARVPAAVDHPRSGERCWTNSAHLFQANRRVYGWLMWSMIKLFFLVSRKPMSRCVYADGTPITAREVDQILDTFDRNTVEYKMRAGDVMLVDNIRVMHGRNTFRGPRKLMFAMYE